MSKQNLLYILIWAVMAFALPKAARSQQAKTPDSDSACASSGLPEELQEKLAAQFASWKIQEIGDLSPSATARWSGGYYAGCPGVATGDFREKHRKSYGVLLVPHDKPDFGYRLVIYSPASEASVEEFTVIEKHDGTGASNFFVNASHLDELFDESSRRKWHMSAKDALLFFDAGETEYEVDAYYWSENAYRNAPVDL